MSVHAIARRGSANGVGTANSCPIYNNSTSNDVRVIPTGTGTTEVILATTTTTQALLGKTLAGADGIVKVQPVTGTKTWISGTPYAAFTVTNATLQASAGIVFWAVTAINATDVQIDCFHTTYAAVNKAGTSTVTHTYVSAEEAKAVSTGTLTFTATATDSGSGVATFNITGTSSITPTTLLLSFTVFPIAGSAVTVF
jgi:hypothetical protein